MTKITRRNEKISISVFECGNQKPREPKLLNSDVIFIEGSSCDSYWNRLNHPEKKSEGVSVCLKQIYLYASKNFSSRKTNAM